MIHMQRKEVKKELTMQRKQMWSMFKYQKNQYWTLAHMIWKGASAQEGADASGINMHQITTYLNKDWDNINAIMNAPPPASAMGPGYRQHGE